MLSEDKTRNWRDSYQRGIGIKIRDLKNERAAQVKRRLYIGCKTYVVKDMTDAQIESVARVEAACDVEMAINMHNEKVHQRGHDVR